jgi:hypothetical protein
MYSEGKTGSRQGVEGNARLTGASAVVLLVLLAAEGATIPFIGRLVQPHVFIGMMLIPPILLKLGSTGYRFARYYTGSPPYRRKGPPSPPMRVLAPGVVLTTVALFASGVALALAGPEDGGPLKFLHQASFVAWFGFMTIHVLGHLLEVPRLAVPDWRRGGGREAALAGSGMRLVLIAIALAAGLALALATTSLAGPWLSTEIGG